MTDGTNIMNIMNNFIRVLNNVVEDAMDDTKHLTFPGQDRNDLNTAKAMEKHNIAQQSKGLAEHSVLENFEHDYAARQ
jgi:hypothetical protein